MELINELISPIQLEPLEIWPPFFLGGTIFLTLVYLLTWGLGRGAQLGRQRWVRLSNCFLTIFAACMFTIAVYNPVLYEDPEVSGVHLVVVADISNSILRSDESWLDIKQNLARFLRDSIANMPEDLVDQSTGGWVAFERGVSGSDTYALDRMSESIVDDLPELFTTMQDSDLSAGLQEGMRQIQRNGGRGAVLLLSDGNETTGDAQMAADLLAEQGIPIFVLPIESGQPTVAIESLNFADQVNAGQDSFIRGVLSNGGATDAPSTLTLAKNPGLIDLSTSFGPALQAQVPITLSTTRKQFLREPIRFEGVGLQFVDLTLTSGDVGHHRRFYTHVNEPAKFLAIGGSYSWVGGIDPALAEVDQVRADEVPEDLSDYDVIVIGAVPAEELGNANLQAIADVVNMQGTGLMMINGDHGGIAADEELETILRSYEETVLADLLPVSTEPRPETIDPPSRRIMFILDTSGSMQGQRLDKAREVIQHIVLNLLTQNDTVDLILFTSEVEYRIKNDRLDETNLSDVVSTIRGGFDSGGTDPTAAVALINNLNVTNDCALIFISDGEFNTGALSAYRPDCHATVFDIGQEGIDPASPLYLIAVDPIPVGLNFAAADITIPYFEPEERNKFFETGQYTPISLNGFVADTSDLVPVPPLPLDGNAISYIKDRSVAEEMAWRRRPRDPLLVYGLTPNEVGYVGVFTTDFTPEWLADEAGREAIQTWMMRLVPYQARDRYKFDLEDDGDLINLTLSIRSVNGGPPPNVSGVIAELMLEEDGTTYSIPLVKDINAPATFSGVIDVPRLETSQVGMLVLTEDTSSPDSLARPQRIPMIVPPLSDITARPTNEAATYGLNIELLRSIAERTDGLVAPTEETPLFLATTKEADVRYFWMIFIVIGAAAYLGSIGVRRFDY